jgi:rubredoxin
MKNNFICPNCNAYLNVGQQIILSATNKNGISGLILFNPELGNYSIETNPEFIINEGEKYDFYCPVCQEKLASKIHDNLSRIILIDNENKQFEILFSKIAGEKSTYKIIGESVEFFGNHHSNYIDFLNLCVTK